MWVPYHKKQMMQPADRIKNPGQHPREAQPHTSINDFLIVGLVLLHIAGEGRGPVSFANIIRDEAYDDNNKIKLEKELELITS